MPAPFENPQDEGIADLFGRLIEDGRAVARAEVRFYKTLAAHRAKKAQTGIAALAAGGVLLLYALGAAILGIVLALALRIGPLAAGALVAVVLAGLGYLLVRKGLVALQGLSGDEEERAALAEVEQRT